MWAVIYIEFFISQVCAKVTCKTINLESMKVRKPFHAFDDLHIYLHSRLQMHLTSTYS